METASESGVGWRREEGGGGGGGGGVRLEATLIYAVCVLAGSRERCLCVWWMVGGMDARMYGYMRM